MHIHTHTHTTFHRNVFVAKFGHFWALGDNFSICCFFFQWNLVLLTSEEEEITQSTENDESQQPVKRVDGDDHNVRVKQPAPHVS